MYLLKSNFTALHEVRGRCRNFKDVKGDIYTLISLFISLFQASRKHWRLWRVTKGAAITVSISTVLVFTHLSFIHSSKWCLHNLHYINKHWLLRGTYNMFLIVTACYCANCEMKWTQTDCSSFKSCWINISGSELFAEILAEDPASCVSLQYSCNTHYLCIKHKTFEITLPWFVLSPPRHDLHHHCV